MIRLQRVTFLALHNYLGLTTELTRPTDEPSQVQNNDQHHRRRGHAHSHASVLKPISANTTDPQDIPEEDSSENQNFQPARSLSNDSEAINTSNTTTDQNPSETVSVSSVPPEGQLPSILTTKERASSFGGQRSYSVIEDRSRKPDFEEAAARARVKNSLDTTFFEKHKISYPNVSNSRLSNSGTRRRSSFSDVKSFDYFFSYSN